MAGPDLLSGVGAKVGAGLSTASMYTYYVAGALIVLFGIGALLWYVTNKRSYNVHVVILRPRSGSSAYDWEAGYFGKHVLNKVKELRFQIYNSKKYKLQYNQEAIDQKYFIKRLFKGKYHNLVFLTPNSEGWLQPSMMQMDNIGNLKATVSNSDFTYYMTELSEMDKYYDDKDFFSKYGMFILVILSIINACILAYAVYKLGGVSAAFEHASTAFSDAAVRLGANATQSTTGTVIKIG